MEALTVAALIAVVVSLMRIVTAAFMESFPTGILCMGLPGYILYFAIKRYRFFDRIPVLILFFGGLMTFTICLVWPQS